MNKEIRTVTRQLARFGLQESDLLFTWDQKPTIAEKLLRRILTNTGLTIDELPTLEDAEWANTVKNASYGVERRGGECIINPLEEEIPLADIDLYMKGIIRWMNELGLYTLYCCDGHGRRTPYVSLFSYPSSKQLRLLHACAPVGMTIRPQGKKLLLQCQNPTELLLQFAERLHQAWSDPAALVELEAEQFKPSLLHLLSISGESGNEGRIRQFLRSRLTPMTDTLFVDRAGNLCGTVLCGEGPTVLLSAHMDLYEELAPDRQILQQGTVLSSSKGILGGDDRAGIAIILEVLRHFHQTNFNGTLKVAFTVKEEIGLIGAKKLDPSFLADVDAAIVVDRRGTRDIVTSCRGIVAGPAIALGGFLMEAKSKKNLAEAKANLSKARKAAEEFQTATSMLEAISQIAEQFGEAILELETRMNIVLNELEEALIQAEENRSQLFSFKAKKFFSGIVGKGTPLHYADLNMEQKEILHVSYQFAQVMKMLLETPLLDKKGALDENCLKAIEPAQSLLGFPEHSPYLLEGK